MTRGQSCSEVSISYASDGPFTAIIRVPIPSGTPNISDTNSLLRPACRRRWPVISRFFVEFLLPDRVGTPVANGRHEFTSGRETLPPGPALCQQKVPLVPAFHSGRTAMKADFLARRPVGEGPMRLVHCFCYFCLVLSLPWSIWVTRGWIGLLLHFQVASGAAWMLDRVLWRRKPLRSAA